MTANRLRRFAGLAAAVVPFAIIVHLVAEAAAIGCDRLDLGFALRHSYFALIGGASGLWFASTVGLGCSPGERRRRCALVRADLRTAPRYTALTTLVVANLAFFALTQVAEGVPFASGAVGFGLAVALAGSALSALLVFFFGLSIVASALESVLSIVSIGHAAKRLSRCVRVIVVPRAATIAYSLFIPNRPPPTVLPL